MGDGIEPRRPSLLAQELVGHVEVSAFAEDVGQVGCPHEARRQVHAAAANVAHDLLHGNGTKLWGQEIEVQGEHVARLRQSRD